MGYPSTSFLTEVSSSSLKSGRLSGKLWAPHRVRSVPSVQHQLRSCRKIWRETPAALLRSTANNQRIADRHWTPAPECSPGLFLSPASKLLTGFPGKPHLGSSLLHLIPLSLHRLPALPSLFPARCLHPVHRLTAITSTLLEGPGNSERYLSWASAFLVVYSIDNMESFKGCQLYLQTLALHNKTFRPQTPIILLGTKLDMDRYRLVTVQVSQCDAEALASRFGCLFFEVSACLDFLSVQHVFYEAVRRARRGGERGHLVPAVYISEDKALLSVPSFTTPCYKELPAPATAKLVTVKTSRAQSMRRAATLNLLKGFKIF
ncbi:ras-like protein family member 12 isoform X3 [Siniperca chuatsi]|uniref:ras-like protein family member 12 isoform X3 n=1 Tax=Siniperca chuatsi TaxID=119488 RepID=UPI001CE216FD|nr:ras-like protein family member 12 isoform X3 [Siniperca chuatsi]XP_044058260.1 ras-like protein family member 12 isoform X3 [Siniperca chuatsi]